MTLRTRLAAAFALIALSTSAAVSLAVPVVVGQGIQQLEGVIRSESPSPSPSVEPAATATPTPGRPTATSRPRPSCDRDHWSEECERSEDWTAPTTTSQPSRRPSPGPTDWHDDRPDTSAEPSHDRGDGRQGARPSSEPHGPGDPGNRDGASDSGQARGDVAHAEEAPEQAVVVLAVARPTVPTMPAPNPQIPTTGQEPPDIGEAAESTSTSAADVGTDTSLKLVLVALGAAVVASLLGLLAADRLVRPLRRLQSTAAAVATGKLEARSGLAARSDEIGDLARSFDTMADALQAAETGRRRFLQDAVHELRTPLTVIEATASAVIDGVYAPEPRHLETIRAQARLLSRVVDDLRTISLAEAQALELRREPVDAGAALRGAVDGFSARAERSGISLVLDAPETLVAEADPERLHQILGALIDNAIRHTPEGGTITLAGSANDGFVRLDVRDNGPGIAAEDLPHVFERFYQADLSRDRARGSSGLGLAIVKALAEAHGGTVGVQNGQPGGADFWVELPAA